MARAPKSFGGDQLLQFVHHVLGGGGGSKPLPIENEPVGVLTWHGGNSIAFGKFTSQRIAPNHGPRVIWLANS